MNSVLDKASLKRRNFVQKKLGLFGTTESHHRFHNGAVVPRAVEKDHFTGAWQLRNIALEIPLSRLGFRGFGQSDHACAARIDVLCKAGNRTSLTGSIAAFKNHGDLESGIFDVALHLQQFNLQCIELFFVERVVVVVKIWKDALTDVGRKLIHVLGMARFHFAVLCENVGQ